LLLPALHGTGQDRRQGDAFVEETLTSDDNVF